MGLEILVSRNDPPPLSALLERLAVMGMPAAIVMVDNILQAPGSPAPTAWRDVRLKTPMGTVTLVQRDGGIGVVVFGNASVQLQEAQRRVGAAVAEV